MDYPFENLLFEGGGVKGLAFCGALEVLEDKGVMKNIKRLAGSSAGAITAGLLACGYTYDRISQELQKKNFNDFRDNRSGSTVFTKVARKVRGAWSVFGKFGFHTGDDFYEWYGELLKKATGNENITFSEVYNAPNLRKELVITGTNVSLRQTEYYSKEYEPDMPIRDAVRISMSLPIFFQPIKRDENILVDGGVLNNYPVWVFDEGAHPGDPASRIAPANPKTLGLKLLTPEEVVEASGPAVPQKIDDIKDFAEALVDCLMRQVANFHVKPEDEKRTIEINTGDIKTKQFNLSESEKRFLLDEGRKAAKKFFVAYDSRH